eukprot:m.82276 g.82276  ORF g.82276 m.82276 type:complete len:630 (-) comp25503_c0_seq1:123-2012(-)
MDLDQKMWAANSESQGADHHDQKAMAYYDDSRHLVYGRNHIQVQLKHQKLRGYLAVYTRPGCGPLLSWVPFSVLSGITVNNPDVDKEILVQLHNVSSLVVRTYPCAPTVEYADMEVIVYGVDGKAYPGFLFAEGGAETFVYALSKEYEIDEIDKRVSPEGLKDQTYKFVKPKQPPKRQSPTKQKHFSSKASPSSAPSSPSSSVWSSFSNLFRHPSSTSVLSPRSQSRSRSSTSSSLGPHCTGIDAHQVEAFSLRCQHRRLRDVVVAWRLHTYRQRKILMKAAELVICNPGNTWFPWAQRRPSGTSDVDSEGMEAGLTEQLLGEITDDADGNIIDSVAFFTAIGRGGCRPSLRELTWKLLLHQYELHHNLVDRTKRNAQVAVSYKALVREYKLAALSNDTRDRADLVTFLEQCDTIDQDVERSDFHTDITGEYQTKLRRILRTFVFHNLDRGYVQGMLDLLEPILFVLNDEASSFQCFAYLLERSGSRFDCNSETGIEWSLSKLRTLLAYEQPELSDRLKLLDADYLFFTYRWFLLDFKREFETSEEVLLLWEATWANEILHCENFTIFIALVLICHHKEKLLNCKSSNEIMRMFNNQTTELSAIDVVREAATIMMRLKTTLKTRGIDSV